MRCLPQLNRVAFHSVLLFVGRGKLCMATLHGHLIGEATIQWPNLPLLGSASGRPISCSVENLRLHPVVESFGNLQFEQVSNGGSPRIIPEPILVTPNGTILSGF